MLVYQTIFALIWAEGPLIRTHSVLAAVRVVNVLSVV
ncbi:MAG: hypothetical protein A4E70_00201 [Syntrophus sp. PtaU1.Bin005]|nr:MAG: hypothetical protein A4E70_00201 [Syntrophus sp. PtaU1.Bin005]